MSACLLSDGDDAGLREQLRQRAGPAGRDGSSWRLDGSTAQQGGFGLSGVVGQGSAVPGQVSSTPDVASFSGQPLTTMPAPGGFSSDPAAQPAQPSNQYAQIGNALKAAAAGQQKQGQQRSGGMMGAAEVGGRPISLQQARAMFDPGKFYGTLRNAGVRGV